MADAPESNWTETKKIGLFALLSRPAENGTLLPMPHVPGTNLRLSTPARAKPARAGDPDRKLASGRAGLLSFAPDGARIIEDLNLLEHHTPET
jgi:hypothetical protein